MSVLQQRELIVIGEEVDVVVVPLPARLAGVCLKGPKRLFGWCRGSCNNVGNVQPVQIDAFPGHSNFLIGSNKYRTAKSFSQIKGLNGQGKAVIHIYRC